MKTFSLTLMLLFLSLLGCNPGTSRREIFSTPTLVSEIATLSASSQPTFMDTMGARQATPHFQQTQLSIRQATAAAALTQVADREATATARIIQATASAPTPDWIAIEKELASAVMAATSPMVIESHLSPDGQWRAEVISYDCVDVGGVDKNAYELLRLVQIDGGVETLVADQLQYCGGIGAYGLGFVYWSPNSRYLYYTESAYGVPDGGGMAWYRSLSRFDLLSGETNDLRWGPLAPDGVTMAYPDPWELALYLWDLDRGEIARIPSSLPAGSTDAAIFGITWSPDGKSLVYIEAENADGPTGKSWLVKLDLATFDRKVIYQFDSGMLCCVEGQIPGQIQIRIDSETQLLNLPQIEHGTLMPSSLWCERPDDLVEIKVAITRLPGAPQSFCIVWLDSIKEVTSFRVELKYKTGNELFQYIAGPQGTQWIVPFEYQPRLEESQEQFMRRHSYSVYVYALRQEGQVLVGATATEVDNPDFLLLPTATSVP